MATVPHVTFGSELRKFQADGFLLDRVYLTYRRLIGEEFCVPPRYLATLQSLNDRAIRDSADSVPRNIYMCVCVCLCVCVYL